MKALYYISILDQDNYVNLIEDLYLKGNLDKIKEYKRNDIDDLLHFVKIDNEDDVNNFIAILQDGRKAIKIDEKTYKYLIEEKETEKAFPFKGVFSWEQIGELQNFILSIQLAFQDYKEWSKADEAYCMKIQYILHRLQKSAIESGLYKREEIFK